MAAIPVHVISGFLGAGKTTLLNHLLRGLPGGLRPAVIVNDFGSVAVDAALVERGTYALAELASGCVCCTLRGPLEDALVALADDESPDLMVMETTGLAEPAAFPAIFAAPELALRVRLGNIVCVVDASTFLRYEEHLLALPRQVMQCNTVVVNKVDLLDRQQLAAVRRRMVALSPPETQVVDARNGAVDGAVVLDQRPLYLATAAAHGHEHEHEAVAVETAGVLALGALQTWLQSLVGAVDRAKGVVTTDAGPRLIQLSLAGLQISDWPDAVACSRLVFVGRHLDTQDLQAALDATLVAGDGR